MSRERKVWQCRGENSRTERCPLMRLTTVNSSRATHARHAVQWRLQTYILGTLSCFATTGYWKTWYQYNNSHVSHISKSKPQIVTRWLRGLQETRTKPYRAQKFSYRALKITAVFMRKHEMMWNDNVLVNSFYNQVGSADSLHAFLETAP